MIKIKSLVENPISLPSGLLVGSGETATVKDADIIPQHIGRLYSIVGGTEENSAEEVVDCNIDDSENPQTLDDYAAVLAAEPELLLADDFTKSGKPEVAAIERVFERDFTADERNEIWEKVQELVG